MNDPLENENIVLGQARRDVYFFLSKMFLQVPEKEIIENVLCEDFLSIIPTIADGDEIHPMRSFADSYNDNLKDLSVEYHNLFVVPFKHTYVTPYESVYMTGLMCQDPTDAVKRFYREAGYAISKDFHDIPDHIGMELQFMGSLCDREIDSRERNDTGEVIRALKLEHQFLKEHLLGWVSKLVEKIQKNSENYFYRGISEFLKDFIFFDKGQVDELLLEFEQ